MLVGPDGCHYENEHHVLHYAVLHLCGCGQPEEAFNLCRDVLDCFDRREARKGGDEWIDAEAAVTEIIKTRPEITAHVISHLLTHFDLLEHGSSVGGSWLTTRGERVVDHGPMTEALIENGR